jgi:hypothetical protein
MHLLLRRFLPAVLLAFSLLVAPSALGAHHVQSARSRAANNRGHVHVRRHKADSKSAKKGNIKSARKTDKKSASNGQARVFDAAVGSTTTLFGESAVQSRRASLWAGRSEAFRFRSLTSGTAGIAQIYIDSSNTAGDVIIGIYSDANGRPGELLSVGLLAAPVAGAWNWAPLTATSIAPNTYYWLSILGEGGTLGYRDHRRGSCLSATGAQHNLASLPSSWGVASIRQECPISGFVTTAAEQVLLPPPPTSPPPTSPPPTPTPPTPAPPTLAPTNTTLPTVSGTATEGQALTASTGTWTGSPTSLVYQWQDCDGSGSSCVDDGGATSASYTLTVSDVGHTVRVLVTAANAGGSTVASSTASAVVAAVPPPPPPPPPPAPTNTVLPAVSGTATEGEALTATVGAWSASPASYSYQWQDCDVLGESCTEVAGANAVSYTLGANDVGHTVRVVVTATNAGGSTSADSLASAVVTSVVPPVPTNLAMPAVSGNTMQGEVLSTTSGAWTGAPTSYAYQWRDCNSSGHSCTNIGGATAPDYKLTTGDVNHRMRVMVTATNAGGSSSMSSPATEAVAELPTPAPTNTVLPAIGGTATEGQTLTATAGTWTGSPTSLVYQWQDCEVSGEGCVDIGGASSASYTLAASDVEHTVRVVVTATNSGGSTAAASVVTAIVVADPPPPPPPPPSAPTNTALPVISGTATEGQTLTATAGTWTGSPTSLAYQWQDCNGSGASCSNIAGATNSTHKLAASDIEHTIRVVVTATNSGGSTAATSAATGSVAAVVVNTGCTTTIGSGLSTAIKNAAAGSTVCLNAGNYGEVSVTTSKSSMVTIKPSSGVSQSQAVLGYVNVTTSSNLTFEGVTIGGGNSGSSSTPATHIHWVGDAFTSGLCLQAPTSANIDLLVEGSTFFDIAEGRGGCGNEGRLEVNGDNEGPSGTNGVVISHDTFGRSGCTDGVNITGGASGTVIGPSDIFENMKEGSCAAHVDPIQFYGAKNNTVTGDYFHGNSDGIMSPDGNGSPMTVTNCVFDTDGEYPWQIVIGGGEHDVISHDTFGHGAMVRIGHVNVGATASNETITDNVLTGGLDLTEGQSSSGWKMEYNLVEGEVLGTHSISGKPTYSAGGSEPSTWAGWQLTSSSLGHLAAGDGTDMGAGYFGS